MKESLIINEALKKKALKNIKKPLHKKTELLFPVKELARGDRYEFKSSQIKLSKPVHPMRITIAFHDEPLNRVKSFLEYLLLFSGSFDDKFDYHSSIEAVFSSKKVVKHFPYKEPCL